MRRTAISTAAALTLAAATLTATGAHASYPGANGRLAFGLASNATSLPDIYSILPNGRRAAAAHDVRRPGRLRDVLPRRPLHRLVHHARQRSRLAPTSG